MFETIYLLAATGGLEDPSFETFLDEDEALTAYRSRSAVMTKDPGVRIDVLRIDSDGDMFTIASASLDEDGNIVHAQD